MAYANPEVYGTPDTWQDCFYAGGSTGAWTNIIHAKKAKVPQWAVSNPSWAGTFSSSQLRAAVADNKIRAQEPIDKSICPIPQGGLSPIRRFAVYANIPDDYNPSGLIRRIGSAYTGTAPVKTFWYEANVVAAGNTGVYGNGAFCRCRIPLENSPQRVWSPDGENINGGNKQNGNFFIAPLLSYETRTFVLQILVYVLNAEYDHEFEPGSLPPQGTWRTLDTWKNSYSTHPISGCLLRIRTAASYSASTGTIGYIAPNYDSSQYRKVSCGILDELKFEIDDGTQISDMCNYGLLAQPSNSWLGVTLFMATDGMYKWSDSSQTIALINEYAANYIRSKGTLIVPYIPYDDEVYEYLMSACACFGMPFTPAKGIDTAASRCEFNQDYLDSDLCLPIIDSQGICQGEYTRGTANIQNQYYNLVSIFDYEPIVPVPAERPEQINVYDINEPQNGFDHNGLAILMPIECISDKEERGRWDLTLVHPIDDYNKWTYIIGQNVLKVNGQLFRIDETEIYQDAEQSYITAHAKHITYDLYDRFVDDLTVENAGANEYVYKVIKRSEEILPTHRPEPNEYTFNVSSDITELVTNKVQDQTVIGALFGDDNSLASRYGGQVYRDNFHMSINSTLEGAPQSPAFKLRFGTDLTKLSYKIDFSQWITELICKDNLGNLWGISYTGSTWIIHHQKTRIIHFTYDPETPDPMGCLERDGFAYWQTVSTPTVSIEVSVANLKNDPKYKDFVDLQNLDVGYTGNVYIEQYNIDVNMKIVSIRRNELTGEALQVVLGTSRGSFIRSPVMSQTIVANGTVLGKQELEMQAMHKEIANLNLKQMRTWGGMKEYKWADVKQYTWGEIINGHKN